MERTRHGVSMSILDTISKQFQKTLYPNYLEKGSFKIIPQQD